MNSRVNKILSISVDDIDAGWVLDSEASYQCFGDGRDTVRRPDVSFIRHGRLAGEQLPDGHLTIAPDLAVETIAPNDRVYEAQSKFAEYLEAGVRLVWGINPADRTVTVYSQKSDLPRVVRCGEELTGGEVLPECSCPVASLFPADKQAAE